MERAKEEVIGSCWREGGLLSHSVHHLKNSVCASAVSFLNKPKGISDHTCRELGFSLAVLLHLLVRLFPKRRQRDPN